MGIIRSGIYEKVTLFLKQISEINEFVETGTYYGTTTEWASNHFGHVSTIELSEELYNKTLTKLCDKKNITFYQGDSRNHLQYIINTIGQPAIFWLDAHWSGGETAGEDDQCPLIQELNIIYTSPYDHIVMIDDARTYTLPPRKPNDPEQFPNICDIIDITRRKEVYITILEDVIYIIPSCFKSKILDFFQEEAAKSEESYRKLISDSELYHKIPKESFYKRLKKAIKKHIL